MGRKRKASGYSILPVESLFCVSADRVYEPDSEPEKCLLDELDCPAADEVLIALRKAFSLTFPKNPFIDGVQASILEIRRIGVEALKPMPEVLSELKVAPLPLIMDDPVMRKVRLHKFVFAQTRAIDISVKVGSKKQRLLDVVEHQEATSLLTTLRSVITETFAESHDEDQHMEILYRIRQRIHDVLPAFNACLESIEIEPIAEQANAINPDAEASDESNEAG